MTKMQASTHSTKLDECVEACSFHGCAAIGGFKAIRNRHSRALMTKMQASTHSTKLAKMTQKVFISYSSEDTSVAENICNRLEADGIKCWIAPRDVTPGMIYAGEIIEAIRSVSVFVLVFSDSANKSPHVRTEVERAFSNSKVLITVRIQNVPMCEPFEYFLAASHWLDAWESPISKWSPLLAQSIKKAIASPLNSEEAESHLLAPKTDSAEVEWSPHDSLVGRKSEVSRLRQSVDRAADGIGHVAMLAGEAGIGKTRISEELADYSLTRGVCVLKGRCHEQAGAPAFWPWLQAIREHVFREDAEILKAQLGVGAPVVGQILPEIGQRLGVSDRPPDLDDPESARFRLFDYTTSFVKKISQSTPVMIFLDDLHWADEPSLKLLEFMGHEIRESRILILGTFRDTEITARHPLTSTLGDLSRDRLYEIVNLHGLAAEDVGRFVEDRSDSKPPSGLISAIHTHTEGNPLYVTEVVRLLEQDGELSADSLKQRNHWDLRIPESVQAVISRRLAQLSDECYEVLKFGSVIGRHFTSMQLRRVVKPDTENTLLSLLDEAVLNHILDEDQESPGNYQFTHALVQETFLSQLTVARKAHLHAQIAVALESFYGDDADRRAEELAFHYGQAESILGSEKSVRFSLLAGELAIDQFAYEAAGMHFERVLRAKTGKDFRTEDVQLDPLQLLGNVAMDAEVAQALFGLGRTQFALERRKEALASLSASFDYFYVNDSRRAVAVASFPLLAGYGEQQSGATEMSKRAMELVLPNSYDHGRLLCEYGFSLYLETRDHVSALRAIFEAIEIAEKSGALDLEVRALSNIAMIESYELNLAAAVEHGLEVAEKAKIANDMRSHAIAYGYVTNAALLMGDRAKVRAYVAPMIESAESVGIHIRMIYAYDIAMSASMWEGDWAAARKYNDQALAILPTHIGNLAMRVLLEYLVGDVRVGSEFMEKLMGSGGTSPVSVTTRQVATCEALAVTAYLSGNESWMAMATEIAETVLSSPETCPDFSRRAEFALGFAAVQQGNPSAAEKIYALLSRREKAGLQLSAFMCTHRMLGLLSSVIGDGSRATRHFERALVLARGVGYLPEAAWICYDYGRAIFCGNAEGDEEKALSLTKKAYDASIELGITSLTGLIKTNQG